MNRKEEEIYEKVYQDKKKDQYDPVYISNEMYCCDGLPMLVKMPETLICQVCEQKFMNLVTGVEKVFIGVLTKDNIYT